MKRTRKKNFPHLSQPQACLSRFMLTTLNKRHRMAGTFLLLFLGPSLIAGKERYTSLSCVFSICICSIIRAIFLVILIFRSPVVHRWASLSSAFFFLCILFFMRYYSQCLFCYFFSSSSSVFDYYFQVSSPHHPAVMVCGKY